MKENQNLFVALRDAFPTDALDRVADVHEASGRHASHRVPLDAWVPVHVAASARALDERAARAALAGGVPDAAALFADLGLGEPPP